MSSSKAIEAESSPTRDEKGELSINPTATQSINSTLSPTISSPESDVFVAPISPTAPVKSNAQVERKYSGSHEKTFHRRFSQVQQGERLINYFSCALLADILLQGYLYISENHFGFYSNIFGYKTKLLIPISDVIEITREKTVKIIPNAVGIVTGEGKYVFGSLISRETTYRVMYDAWSRYIPMSSMSTEKERQRPFESMDTGSESPSTATIGESPNVRCKEEEKNQKDREMPIIVLSDEKTAYTSKSNSLKRNLNLSSYSKYAGRGSNDGHQQCSTDSESDSNSTDDEKLIQSKYIPKFSSKVKTKKLQENCYSCVQTFFQR
ncbi:hypothetical protein B4U79_13671, partial [Dinothrombium tinctorium]|uniref:GRAM domain-containing protein n=1 Tax=Dinothrombium tinctorium TaxID=1965070 RepID=A0A3S3P5X4_9ACAR